ncbi:WAT1-related protein At3g18200 [Nematostella vectensis]|uniref:WAT1-related protein At3g18200 n=1 Tax=Nematostella vectensis TaxID=45351 RepID=UPI002076F5F5|nr:WAT1-related protein At3g18200 [Nematostella vectensis]
MASYYKVLLALVIVQLGYGGYGVIVAKFAKSQNVNPVLFALTRLGGAFPVLLLTSVIFEQGLQIPKPKEAGLFLLLGLTGSSLSILFCVLGIRFTNAKVATIFQSAMPVWTALLAILTRIEPRPEFTRMEGWTRIFGIVLASTGAITMMLFSSVRDAVKDFLHPTYGDIIGYCFLLGNTLCMTAYVLIQKKFIFNNEESPWKNKPIGVTAWSYLVGATTMAMAAMYCLSRPGNLTYVVGEQVYSVLYAIFIASFLCDMLITWCNMHISSSVVTATWPLQVLVSAVLSYIVLDELMNTVQIVGGALIMFGLISVVWSNYRTEQEKKENALFARGISSLEGREEVFLPLEETGDISNKAK